MEDIYLLIDGNREGPFTENEIRESIVEGYIPYYTPAWHGGTQHWLRVGKLVALTEKPAFATSEQSEKAVPQTYSI